MAVVINDLEVTPAAAPAPASQGSGGGEAPPASTVQKSTELARTLARHRERAERVRAH